MTLRRLAFLFSAIASAPAAAADVYILAGQSNMSGRGSLAELTPEERTPDPQIFLYGNDGRWRLALDPLDSAASQRDEVSSDTQAAVGPGLTFAREMRRRNGRAIVLVPCAKGGSSLRQWRPGGGRDTLYGSCLARAREAGGRVAGILWYQGETDARTPAAASRWRDEFGQLMASFRRDLHNTSLPVVLVQLADRPDRDDGARVYPAWQQVQEAQASVAAPCLSMVSARGLPRNADELHLSIPAHRTLGQRLATAMITLAGRGCPARQ